jgi:PAS domain S-box-containing protein
MVTQQPPDLILLDIMMPGMNGFEVAAKIKSNAATKNIPVIMITALTDQNSRMLGLSAGAEDFLTKPVNRAELCVRVRNLSRLKTYGDDKTEQAALLDLTQDAIFVRDMRHRIVFWSRGAEVMYGWSNAEAIGENVYKLLRTEYSQPIEHIEARVIAEGRWQGEAIHHRRDGTRLTVASRWALERDAAGEPVRILTIANDITDHKRAETELLSLTQRLSLATAVAKVGVWEWDLGSDIVTTDATMSEIYGFAPGAAVTYKTWSEAVYPEDVRAVDAMIRKGIRQKGEISVEYRITRPDGSIRNLSSAARVVLDDRARGRRLIGVNMDVTEQKQAEETLELVRQDEMRYKAEFLSHVSHELRSPLTAIKQFTTLLLRGLAGELNKEQREFQEIVLRNIRQLQSMIDDLLEVTRLETGKFAVRQERVSVVNAITDTINTLEGTARVKGVTISYDVPPDLLSAYADPTRLRQVLIILLDNAIKFTPDGGDVAFLARPMPGEPQSLLLEVSDTGIGISAATTEKIFERLFQVSERTQTSRKGLGLGLYICKELVTRQGGRIWAKRRTQKGSTFSFTLPVYSGSIAPALVLDGASEVERRAMNPVAGVRARFPQASS